MLFIASKQRMIERPRILVIRFSIGARTLLSDYKATYKIMTQENIRVNESYGMAYQCSLEFVSASVVTADVLQS